jgi:UDPglucose 6-dehydrogenase
MNTPIGFVGQGWIGRHYADEFETRGYQTVRYALEEPYVQNKSKIADCEIVFIAVPTPTTKDGFDASIVREALTLIGKGKTAVIKSTLLPGTTKALQTEFPDICVLHSPEFLSEKTAAYDAANPNRNLIGIPQDTLEYRKKAEQVMDVLPDAPYKHILDANDAELVKYAGNCFLYSKVLFMNILYDMVAATGGDWERVRDALVHDPRIGLSHTEPVHTSGHQKQASVSHRGAGGHCFIKDFEAFRRLYKDMTHDQYGAAVLLSMVHLNNHLLTKTHKDEDLLTQVYGDEFFPRV